LPQRVKFDTGSSVPPKVNSDTEWRQIPKSIVTVHIEVREELSHVEWSHLYVLANDAPASFVVQSQGNYSTSSLIMVPEMLVLEVTSRF
jgi:hypothetical protein